MEKNAGSAKRKSISDLLKTVPSPPSAKKVKKTGYQLENDLARLIEADSVNAKLWEECKEALGDTKQVQTMPVLRSS